MADWLAPRRALPERVLETGGHRATALALAEDRADIGAIDAVTFRLIERFEPELAARLRILDRSPPTPALPLITAQAAQAEDLRGVIAEALTAEPAAAAELGIAGFLPLPESAYRALPMPPPAPASAPNI